MDPSWPKGKTQELTVTLLETKENRDREAEDEETMALHQVEAESYWALIASLKL